MTLNELRSSLRTILEVEQQVDVDWPRAEMLCGKVRDRLRRETPPDYSDDFVPVFLDDAQLRQDDRQYAQVQHERLRNWLEGSEILSR